MSDKILKVKQCEVRVHYCDGYNSHNYGICYEEQSRKYIGEIEDFWNKSESEQKKAAQELVDANWCPTE